jgi:UDP-galactopyranose mutase
MVKEYDYLIVGSGFYGAVLAREMTKRNKKCLVIDKRNHIGGNCYSKEIAGIEVSMYGGHIFHTDNKKIWDYINDLVEFRQYTHSVMANYKGELYHLPFNMNTFHKMWGVKTPEEAIAKIEAQKFKGTPTNFIEQAKALVGEELFEKFIRGYAEKQWGRKSEDIPKFIIKRIPVRFTFDNNYYDHPYQGLPSEGYTKIFERLLENIEVRLNTDFFSNKEYFMSLAEKIIFTGRIDEFFKFIFGKLEYRSLRHEFKELPVKNYMGCPVMNYTDSETPHTRILEFKHFGKVDTPTTVIVIEYPDDFDESKIPYYPINDEKNNKLYEKYLGEAKKFPNVIFGGRLGEYKYYDMDKTIESALKKVEEIIKAEED